MKIELKKIKVLLSNSQETICFSADIYANGVKIGSASNSGRGGATDCYAELRVLYNQAETYLEANRTEPSFDGVMADFVDNAIDDYLEAKEKEKVEKKLAKDMLRGILYGTKTEYTITTWGKYTIDQLKADPKGREVIQKKIKEIQSKNLTILNTNLKEFIS